MFFVGVWQDPEFQSRLRVMDIDEEGKPEEFGASGVRAQGF